MKSLSLRFRILLPIIGLIILGMVITMTLSGRSTSNIVRDLVTSQIEDTTQGLLTQISAWVKDLHADLLTQTTSDIFTDLATQANPSDQDIQAVNSYMKAFIDRYGIYDSITLINTQGKVIAHPTPKVVGLDLSTREYFKQAMSGKSYISNVLKSKVTGRPLFFMAEPLKVNGRIVAVLTSAIELNQFTKNFIVPIKIGSKGYAYMTDKTGIVSAHPDTDAILKTNISDEDWGKKILSEKNGLTTYTFEGIEKLACFRTEPMTGWVIVTTAEINDIFSATNTLKKNNAIISFIAVIIVAIAIVLLIRPITSSLSKAIAVAEKIQVGDLSTRLNLSRGDEIGTLAKALDTMSDRLEQRSELAKNIAHGDLTNEVVIASEQDVLGQALSLMTNRLNEILSQINSASEQIASGSNQVSGSAQDLSQGSTEQASAIEEIGASLNELVGQTKVNAENAKAANQLAAGARNAANDGSDQMQQMVAAMEEINESGQNISKIIKTIDDVAFQTNLLALNAAVEAARAGQHGKGFAVVAEEVRNLAARSAKAAQETADLIEASVQKGENGTEIANRTAASLADIVNGIGKTSDLVAEIAISSQNQAEGLAQVNDGLTQVDQVIQNNTAGAEESAAAAEQLSSQSAYLHQLIGQFKLRQQGSDQQLRIPSIEN